MSDTPDGGLKLAAMDAEDLAVLSAHLQDAVLKRSAMTYTPAQGRFALVCNRFDWVAAQARGGLLGRMLGKGPTYTRRQSTLVVDRVSQAAYAGIDAGDPVLNLLGAVFTPASDDDAASGQIHLHFAGGSCVRLDVECVEARLADLGPAWATHARPDHRAAERMDGA